MKTFAAVFTAIVIGLTLIGTVHAVPAPGSETTTPRELTPGEPRSTEIESDQPRVVTGRVLRVNADEGTLLIQTSLGILALRGPREDLRDVNVGDIVEVEMIEGDYPSASPRIEPSQEQ
jgi:hypothetical protein